MEIMRFIKWLWNDMDTPTKYAIMVAIALGISTVVSFFVKLTVGDIAFFALSTIVVIGVIHGMCFLLHDKWKEYLRIKDMEADRIVRTLSGTSMDFEDEDECVPSQYPLRKIDKKLHIK